MEKHDAYLNSIKDTSEYKRLIEYTGASSTFLKVTDFIRKPSAYSYANVGKNDAKVKEFVDSLNNVITGAPKSAIPINVYRGTGDYEVPIKDSKFVLKGFSGTSLRPETAAGFSESTKCCLYELELPPGTPFLYLKSLSKVQQEEEILLPTNSEFAFIGKRNMTIEGQSYSVFVGKYIRFSEFDQLDLSEKSQIDNMTRIAIKNRHTMIMNEINVITRIYRDNPEKVIEARKNGEMKWLKESEALANKYGVTTQQIQSIVGGKRRQTRKKTRRIKKKPTNR
jgi:hypothetical protein